MTPRERVRRSLKHQEGDRMVIESNSVVSSIHIDSYRNLVDHLGLPEDKAKIPLICTGQRIAQNSEAVLQRLHVDTRYIYPNAPSYWKYNELPNGSWFDMFGTRFDRCGLYCEIAEPIMRNFTLADLKNYKWPDPTDRAISDGLRERARILTEKTDYALVSGWQPAIYYFSWELRGIEQFTYDSVGDKEFYFYLMDKLVDWIIAYLDNILSEIKDYVEWQWYADDWGMQHGPFISPQMFREEMMPREKKIFDFIKRKTDNKVKICHHTCGSTYWCLQELIDIGVDIVHPMQPSADGNGDAARLKKDFGGRISYHGNTNNQGIFNKSREHVEADALYRIKNLAPGGGYIFSSGHNIQVDCPPENILTLFDTAYEYGKYPIDTKRIDARLEQILLLKPAIRQDLPFLDKN
ncbi:MAG: uroporphyrinogen decarboxylase family protein [Spirochaetia bacterium]